MLDKQRIKLNRYEFALKEAVLFLGKPIQNYDNWLNNKDGTYNLKSISDALGTSLKNVPSSTTITQAYALNSPNLPVADNGSIASQNKITSNGQTTKSKQSGSISEKQADNSAQQALNTTLLESQCLECMRLALGFLQSAQKTVTAIDNDTYFVKEAIVVPLENEAFALMGPPKEEPVENPKSDFNTFPDHLLQDKSSVETNALSDKRQSLHGSHASILINKNITPARTISLSKELHNEDDGDAGDISSNLALSKPTITSQTDVSRKISLKKGKCENCRDLLIQIDHFKDDIGILEKKCKQLEVEKLQETNSKRRIIQSKENIDQELEELTSQLFDQANRMVAEHARRRDEIEASFKDLKIKHQEVVKRFQSHDEELKAVKKKLYDLQGKQMQSSTFGSPTNATSSAKSNTISTESPKEAENIPSSHTIVSGYDTFESSIAVDAVIFQEFQEHVKTSILVSNQPPAQALLICYSSVFMKRCLTEDVEPCLFYSYQFPTAGSKSNYGSGLSLSFKRRFLDAALRGKCETKLVSAVSTRHRLSSMEPEGGSSAQAPTTHHTKEKCNVCTIIRETEYALRFQPVPSGTKEWMPICRFCRDRVVSVVDFLTYVNHLRQGIIGPGKQGATILSIFRQMLWLRRRMLLARIGSCGIFETAISAITGPGGGGDWETDVKILL